MEVHILIRCGVYPKGIFGVYSTKELAKAAADRALELEPDTYHDFEILTRFIDSDTEVELYEDDMSPKYLQGGPT